MPTNIPIRQNFANESDRLDRKGRGHGSALGKKFANFKASLLAAKAAADGGVEKIYSFLVGAIGINITPGKYEAKKAFAMSAREEAALNGEKPKPTRSRAGPRLAPA